PRPRSAAYTATKHAVTGLTKQTALDCRGHDICCGQIDIGNAATPLTERMVQGQGVMQPDGRMMTEARMEAGDVGRAVAYMASLPLDTNVLFMTVMANMMPFVGRGCRPVAPDRRDLTMSHPLGPLLDHWHDFYVLVGTAAAALVALLFVATSIGAGILSTQS